MGERPRPIDYASPQEPEPRKEWPAWLVAVTAAVVTLSVLWLIGFLLMGLFFAGFRR
jgi:hypothetical protein